jgi:predicted transcriptional regulator
VFKIDFSILNSKNLYGVLDLNKIAESKQNWFVKAINHVVQPTKLIRFVWEEIMKRSRGEIITQILDICSKGATKTRIVYQANLNFKTVNPYIDLLIEKGLLDLQRGQNKVYMTTKRGSELIESFRSIQTEIELQGPP